MFVSGCDAPPTPSPLVPFLVLSINPINQYERTAFFDAIIERGLRDGTRFNIDHVTSEEKVKLGITMDRASGKFYLAAYGNSKTRRNSTRRGSQTHSDADAADQHHPVIKEVAELLSAEIEAAGENAEVKLLKSRTDPGPSRGTKTVTFTVAIQRAASGTAAGGGACLLYTSPSPRDRQKSRMPSSA